MPQRFLTTSNLHVLFPQRDIFITRFSLAWSTYLTDCAEQSRRENLMKASQMAQNISPGFSGLRERHWVQFCFLCRWARTPPVSIACWRNGLTALYQKTLQLFTLGEDYSDSETSLAASASFSSRIKEWISEKTTPGNFVGKQHCYIELDQDWHKFWLLLLLHNAVSELRALRCLWWPYVNRQRGFHCCVCW